MSELTFFSDMMSENSHSLDVEIVPKSFQTPTSSHQQTNVNVLSSHHHHYCVATTAASERPG
jgi:hypothetical protein